MRTNQSAEQKPAERLAYEHYLRTGQRLTTAEWLAVAECKFNPYHDERGRFTFSPEGSKVTPNKPTATAPGKAKSSPIKPIEGYPETGKNSWRSDNDEVFIKAAKDYNTKYNLKPGDPGYRTPEFMKAWAMRESGGEGDFKQFASDPFQVNNPGDWADKKASRAGLVKGQKMTPAESARGALEWLRVKSEIHAAAGNLMRTVSDFQSLKNYNGRNDYSRQSGKVTHSSWYAQSILEMANKAAGGKP